MGVCDLVAEFYIAHRKWPLTKVELEEQLRRSLEEERSHISTDEAQQTSTFLDQFMLLDLRKSGDQLLFHYRFKIDQQTVDQAVKFAPGPTADEILRTAMANGKNL